MTLVNVRLENVRARLRNVRARLGNIKNQARRVRLKYVRAQRFFSEADETRHLQKADETRHLQKADETRHLQKARNDERLITVRKKLRNGRPQRSFLEADKAKRLHLHFDWSLRQAGR